MPTLDSGLTKTIVAFDWTVKLSAPVDCSLDSLRTIFTLFLRFDDATEERYEFTAEEIYCIGGGLLGFGAIELLFGGEVFYDKGLMPLVHRLSDGETAHRWAIKACKLGLLPRFGPNHWEYPELECEFAGQKLKNPIGLAAGFDKDGEAILPLANSGFGMIEIGSITPLPQPGNPQPRVFRLEEDRAARAAPWSPGMAVFGVNLGKNKMTSDENCKLDYEVGVNHFAMNSDYLVVNVSSPNTPGLRSMQGRKPLEQLLAYVKRAVDMHKLPNPPKIFLKIAPDLVDAELADIAKVVMDPKFGVAGLIISNTTISRPDSLQSSEKDQTGGLSGVPLKELSTNCIRKMYKLTGGKVPIIGCGGIASGADAYEKVKAGASVVQLYTSMVYQGFPVIGRVKRELVECLRKDGLTNISQAVGADHRATKP